MKILVINNIFHLQGWLNLQTPIASTAGSSKKSSSRAGLQSEGVITLELRKKRLLILVVLRREIDRLSIWRNPKHLPELRIPGEDIVQQWINTMPMNDKKWRECIRTAWIVCPKVAIHIALRLVNSLSEMI